MFEKPSYFATDTPNRSVEIYVHVEIDFWILRRMWQSSIQKKRLCKIKLLIGKLKKSIPP